jgi:tetratricopeptide (TPR) repeat protein
MLEWRDDDALDALESLSRARLVAEIPSSNGEGFRFTHPMYSELLRGGIMRLKRKRLHAKAAMLRSGKAEALEITEHWLAAEDYVKALEVAVQAGQTAQAAFAYPQAERAYRMALEAAEHLEAENTASESQQMLMMQSKHALGEVLSAVGRVQEAQDLWRDVIEHAQWLPNSAALIAQAKVDLVRSMRFSGDIQSAILLIGVPKPSEPLYTMLCVELGFLLRTKDPKAARIYALSALKNAKKHADIEELMKAVSALAVVVTQVKRKLTLWKICIRLAEQIGNHHLLSLSWNDLGGTYYRANLRTEAFEAWKISEKYAAIVGNSRILISLEINKALLLMQDTDFAGAKDNLDHALILARRSAIFTVEKYAIYNRALCLYGLNQLVAARNELEQIRDHTLEQVAKVWEARITVELGDGFILQVPNIEPDDFGYGYYQLTQVLLALSFGDYNKAWELTAEPIHDSDWHWALARVHAGWRLGLYDDRAVKKVLSGHADDPALATELIKQYTDFIRMVLSDWTTDIRVQLQVLTKQYLTSPIGVFARDVALSLSEN